MSREWRPVKGYEGFYEVANDGTVRSLPRDTERAGGAIVHYEGRVLTHTFDTRGYHGVTLCKEHKQRRVRVHRLVAEAFVDNPDGKPHVNHLDENKDNNHASNLEWCTPAENDAWGTRNERCKKNRDKQKHRESIVNSEKHRARRKPIIQKAMNGQAVKRWESRTEIRQAGLNDWLVVEVCKGRARQAAGYLWEYE